MWLSHWSLSRDPFSEVDCSYLSLPSHDEAIARIVFAIETGQRHLVLTAPAGMGKTVVVRQSLAMLRTPRRRFARVSCPRGDASLFAAIAEQLGQRQPAAEPGRRAPAWQTLERAVRLLAFQSFQIVVIIDDCDDQVEPPTRRELDSLSNLASLAPRGCRSFKLKEMTFSSILSSLVQSL